MKHAWLYTDLPQVLKGEPSSSVFSTDGTIISTSAAPQCGGVWEGVSLLLEVHKFYLSCETPIFRLIVRVFFFSTESPLCPRPPPPPPTAHPLGEGPQISILNIDILHLITEG